MDTAKIVQTVLGFVALIAMFVSVGITCSAGSDTTYAEMVSEGVAAWLCLATFIVALYRKMRGLDLDDNPGFIAPFYLWIFNTGIWTWLFIGSLGALGYL